MRTKDELISIETLGDGSVMEQINKGIRAVLDNILDKNTVTKKAREVNIKLKITPADDDREFFSLSAEVATKLSPAQPFEARGIVGRETGGLIVAREVLTGEQRQIGIFEKITPIRKDGSND